jgi:O-antigen ligase
MEMIARYLQMRWTWLVPLGALIGLSAVVDPYLRYFFYSDIEEIPVLGFLYDYPYLMTGCLLIAVFGIAGLFGAYRPLTRRQRDQVFLFAVIGTLFINFYGLAAIHLTFILVITGFFLLFLRGAMAGRIDIVWLPINSFYIVLILFMVLSVYGPLGNARITLVATLRFFTGELLPVLFLINVIRTRKQFVKGIHYLVYFALFSSILGIGQFLAFKFFGIDITGTWNQELGRRATLPLFGTFVRVGGLTGNSNTLAQSICTVAVMLTFFLLKPTYFSWRQKVLFFVTVMAAMLATIFSVSRGSWLALAFCFSVIPFIAFPRYSLHILLFGAFLGAVGWLSGLFEYLINSVEDIREASIGYREYIEYIGMDAIRNHPWTGVGLGGIYTYWNWDNAEVHNLWMNLASQIGVIGAAVVVVYYFSLLFRLLRAILHASGFDRIILQSFIVALVFFAVATMVRPLIWDKFFWIYFGFVEIAIHVLGRREMRSKVYYPIFGYSWKDEPAFRVDRLT